MKEAMEQMLTSMGMSDSSSKPKPVECKDCGKERHHILIDHPFKDEKRWVLPACECAQRQFEETKKAQERAKVRQRIQKALRISSNLEDIRTMTFNNYKVRPGAEKAYEEIMDAVENFDSRGKLGVFIFGETGNGKSHLTSAAGNLLIEKDYSVVFITEKDLLSRFNSTKNFNNEESFHEILDACIRADLLIWDDFMSSQRLTNEEKDWIFQIVNGRERANKPIWATSNLTPNEFQSDEIAFKLDDKGRTWWRIVGNMNCIYNRASNYRKAKAMARALDISVEDYENGDYQ